MECGFFLLLATGVDGRGPQTHDFHNLPVPQNQVANFIAPSLVPGGGYFITSLTPSQNCQIELFVKYEAFGQQ